MAKGRDNGTTILLGLEDYKVGEVWGGEDRVMVRVCYARLGSLKTKTREGYLPDKKGG